MLIDLFFISVIVYGFYLGYSKGLFRVIFVFLFMSVAVMVSMLLIPVVGEMLHATFNMSNKMVPYAAFFMTLVIFSLLMWTIYRIVGEINPNKGLTVYGKGFSGLFMSVFLLFIYSGLIGFLTDSRLLKPDLIEKQSMTYKFTLKVERFGISILKYTMPFSVKFFEFVKDSNKKLDSIDKKSKSTE